jgi:hypothetical protein
VIAETADLPTKFAKIVVTDDQGRYVLPDLPKANYTVFVRGYGLVDSPKVPAMLGQALNLTAVPAPDAKAAAQYYPAGYWASLLSIPDKSEFPGKGGDGVNPAMKSQAEWLAWLKNGSCYTCHQLGDKATRELNPLLGEFPSSAAGWARRIQSGQAGPDMVREIGNFGMPRALAMFSDWTDRVKAGELPPAPPRPTGAERNIVITQWHWADEKTYLHDQVSTDRRKPTVNANGLIYGAPELSTENLPILDPLTAKTTTLQVPPRDPKTPVAPGPMMAPSPFFGTEAPWTSRSDVHNPMLDGEGRLWMTARVRPPDTRRHPEGRRIRRRSCSPSRRPRVRWRCTTRRRRRSPTSTPASIRTT